MTKKELNRFQAILTARGAAFDLNPEETRAAPGDFISTRRLEHVA